MSKMRSFRAVTSLAACTLVIGSLHAQSSESIFGNSFGSPTLSIEVPASGVLLPGQNFGVRWQLRDFNLEPQPCVRRGVNSSWAPGNVSQPAQPQSGSLEVQSFTDAAFGVPVQISMDCFGANGITATATQLLTVAPSLSCPPAHAIGNNIISPPSFWPGNFRSTSGLNVANSVNLREGECLALAFDSGSASHPFSSGQLRMFTSVTGAVGAMTVGLSTCPCSFATPSVCQSTPGAKVSVGWRVGTATFDQCSLAPNSTYFVNITFGLNSRPGLGSCPQGGCKPIGGNLCTAQPNC